MATLGTTTLWWRWMAVAIAAATFACGENETHPPRDRYVPPPVERLECVPNLDGRIDAEELRPAVGVPVSYLVSPSSEQRVVDIAGRVDAEGRRVWDFSAGDPNDQVAALQAASLESRWYADSFPGGQFVAPVDAGAQVEGVYVHDEAALWLLGVASADEAPPEGQTLLVYDDPIPLYRFPIAPGDEHVATGEVRNGTFRGLPYAGRDIYEVEVDAVGRLELPDLSLQQAHRIRTKVTVQPAAGISTSRLQVSWFFECFGEVARVTSLPNESDHEFTTASEIRRLSLEP